MGDLAAKMADVPFPEIEIPPPLEDEYMSLCRGCLGSSEEMKDIFEWGLDEDFFECTNLPMNLGEGMSHLLCQTCENTLKVCKMFRTQCLNSNCVMESAARKQHVAKPNPTPNAKENTISCIINGPTMTVRISAPNMDAKIYLPCSYCESSFIKKKDLLAHLIRVHHISTNFKITLQYYCSVDDCSYHIHSEKNKCFQGRKFLNQHYQKVHTDLKYLCPDCTKSFPTEASFNRHIKYCNLTFICTVCEAKYVSDERLLVHLMRKHPKEHEEYKKQKKSLKRKSSTTTESKRVRKDTEQSGTPIDIECNIYDSSSPMRSSATQTKPEDNIKNDVTLPSWQTKTDEISTQTGFEDLLSLKSQASEDESLFFPETVSLSDIQTQTFPIDFGLNRSNKETLTEMQSPDLSIKETQTCFCLYDSPKPNFKLFDSVSSSPCSLNLATAETQTLDRMAVKSDVLLSFNSAQTQTSFEELEKESF